MKFYIAYGSNLNVRQMERRCPHASYYGMSEIKDWRLVFKGSKTGSYLTIEPCEGKSVPVAIWTIDAKDEANLDAYEGFPTFYYKQDFILDVIRYDKVNVSIPCFAYIMAKDRHYGVPSRFYVDTCLQGYEDCGIAPIFLQDALRDTYRIIGQNR